jgi:hypothetical protein
LFDENDIGNSLQVAAISKFEFWPCSLFCTGYTSRFSVLESDATSSSVQGHHEFGTRKRWETARGKATGNMAAVVPKINHASLHIAGARWKPWCARPGEAAHMAVDDDAQWMIQLEAVA